MFGNYSWIVHKRNLLTTAIGAALLIAGIVAIATGAYDSSSAMEMAHRVWPILLFVIAMTVVAEISSKAGVFDVVARIVVQLAGKGPWLLWLLLSLLTVAFTVFLSLDTTVVLVTPLAIVLSRRIGLNPLPYALTVVWLSNTGSMLLPISNLTNLLAADLMGLGSPLAFAAQTWLAALVCVVVPMGAIAVIFRKSFTLPSGASPAYTQSKIVITRGHALSYGLQAMRGRPELVVNGLVLLALIVALVAGIEVWIPSVAAAITLIAYTALTQPKTLHWGMIPVPMIVLTAGLFVALGAAGEMFVNDLLAAFHASDDSLGTLLQTSGLGALTANAINNLPAYLALEPIAHSTTAFVALLIGVNAGPLITPWASLATLLWYERLVAADVSLSWLKYALLGMVVAPLTVVLATVALWAQAN